MDKREIKKTIVHKLFELYDPSSQQNWYSLVSFTMDVPFKNWHDIPEALNELVDAGIVSKLPVHVQGAGCVYYWYKLSAAEMENGKN